MKVTMAKDYKDYMTVHEVELAKEIIKDEKDDEFKAKDWAEYLVREALKGEDDYLTEVLSATAEIELNCKVWNEYNDHSESVDVWIQATAETMNGFIKAGGYLSDIWKTGQVDYRQNIWKRYYTEAGA